MKGAEGTETKVYDDSDYHLFNKMVDQLTQQEPPQKPAKKLQSIFQPKSLRNAKFSEYNYQQDKLLSSRKKTVSEKEPKKPKLVFPTQKCNRLINVDKFKENKISFTKKKPGQNADIRHPNQAELNLALLPGNLSRHKGFFEELSKIDQNSFRVFLEELLRYFNAKYRPETGQKQNQLSTREPSSKLLNNFNRKVISWKK